jgi:hypothetical protein
VDSCSPGRRYRKSGFCSNTVFVAGKKIRAVVLNFNPAQQAGIIARTSQLNINSGLVPGIATIDETNSL